MTESSRERSSATGSSREPDWVRHAIWWQVYPLGFVGAFPADPAPTADDHRLGRITDWLDHAVELGTSGIALGPLFASATHGYDTADHYRIDPRLGDDADFDRLVSETRSRGLRVLLDGVFNHVGTDFPRYREALAGGPDHPSSQWFRLRGKDSQFETFEGHDGLIVLNHDNPEVVDYVVEVMTHWLRRGADGWRLDAAYAVPEQFWAQVLPRVRESFPDAWFVGEVIHGDYAAIVRAAKFDSVTQYELWKATWSSLNDGNFHELDWALGRHDEFQDVFAPMTFVGNHDVTRVASKLDDPRHVEHALVLLLTTGGVPTIYAGDEWAYRGVKEERFGGDDAVRPEFAARPSDERLREDHRPDAEPLGHDVFRLHQHLIGLRRRHPWLHTARTTPLHLTNRHYVYRTQAADDALVVALNVDDTPLRVSLPEFGIRTGRLVAGSGAPAEVAVDRVDVAPHGWAIVAL
jgi:cyclomaltodextrinase